jgi:hypothetical protein
MCAIAQVGRISITLSNLFARICDCPTKKVRAALVMCVVTNTCACMPGGVTPIEMELAPRTFEDYTLSPSKLYVCVPRDLLDGTDIKKAILDATTSKAALSGRAKVRPGTRGGGGGGRRVATLLTTSYRRAAQPQECCVICVCARVTPHRPLFVYFTRADKERKLAGQLVDVPTVVSSIRDRADAALAEKAANAGVKDAPYVPQVRVRERCACADSTGVCLD